MPKGDTSVKNHGLQPTKCPWKTTEGWKIITYARIINYYYTDFGREIYIGGGVGSAGVSRRRERRDESNDRARRFWCAFGRLWRRWRIFRLLLMLRRRRPLSGTPLTEPDQRAPEYAHDGGGDDDDGRVPTAFKVHAAAVAETFTGDGGVTNAAVDERVGNTTADWCQKTTMTRVSAPGRREVRVQRNARDRRRRRRTRNIRSSETRVISAAAAATFIRYRYGYGWWYPSNTIGNRYAVHDYIIVRYTHVERLARYSRVYRPSPRLRPPPPPPSTEPAPSVSLRPTTPDSTRQGWGAHTPYVVQAWNSNNPTRMCDGGGGRGSFLCGARLVVCAYVCVYARTAVSRPYVYVVHGQRVKHTHLYYTPANTKTVGDFGFFSCKKIWLLLVNLSSNKSTSVVLDLQLKIIA